MAFRRKIEKRIKENLLDKTSPILLVDGARQIGKSFIVREVGTKLFANFIEINLKDDELNEGLYKDIKDTSSFYLQLSSSFGDMLGNAGDTLVFLDEIQTYPQLISLLKPLKTDGRFRYIASGSLLGVTMRHIFIPMGSLEEVKMFPMDFEEFLWANGVGDEVISFLRSSFASLTPIPEGIHKAMMRRFREYLISGGLPDAVREFAVDKNLYLTRHFQSQTLAYYKDDAGRYDELHSLKIRRIYDSLASYMQNKVKRVQCTKIENRKGVVVDDYYDEFDYLLASGCVLGAKAIANPVFPLLDSCAKNLIKLYYNDVGLLSGLLYKNSIKAILNEDEHVNLGSVYETAAAMELSAHEHQLFYFDSKKVGEVDFLVNDYESLSPVPVEIKSGSDQFNFRAIPRLLDQNGAYRLKKGYVFGNKNVIEQDGPLITMPIYMVAFL
jgi:uncharacterized protein